MLFASLSSIVFHSFLQTAFALYYPPIFAPKAGDVFPAGSTITVIWDTILPPYTPLSQVANYTSEVRLGIYFGPPPPNEVYEEWTLYSPSNAVGESQPLWFYENQNPYYGEAEFQLPEDICSNTTQYVVAWYDAYPDEVFSQPFSVEGGC